MPARSARRRWASQQAPVEVAPLLYALQRAQSGQRGALEQLERDRGQMAALFEHLADGVLVLDPDERIVLSNPAAARLLGRPLACPPRCDQLAA